MLRLEDYIARRKKEDNINEFDINAKMENMKICVDYIFEYFNQYLNIDEMDQQTFLNNERLEKYRNQVKLYDEDIQVWLVNIFDTYDKQVHRIIANILKKNDLFFLHYTDNDFRSSSYDCYASLIKKYPFMKDQTEMLFRFIKNYHFIQSQSGINRYDLHLSENIDKWLDQTWKKYKVNIWAFVDDYLYRFSENDRLWPARHKVKNSNGQYEYNYKQKNNLFGLNTLYPRISNRPFMKRKKQFLEILMMYDWLHSFENDDDNYWEEYFHNHENLF
ncbi:hypothetical protein OYT88_11990 [Sporolactobacillus sp. CQH2019]|uniref:hypothetical protein n=1 Tax=Sporolactobacillus sp. CQH2019 TaxID=3023512 RepID=UPI00236889E7|nr:hypothetical protein [Sporolactobacillus sp. CQH2019]MDD9149275.1 hypothetical protein [Sporolactobacillus sp. CQH2019]